MTATYETVEGTTPTRWGKHERRTVQRNVSADGQFHDHDDIHMMTEIGDGVFVAWTNCRRCTKRVYDCTCNGGPVEPHYMEKWRNVDRFAKEMNARPDPSYEMLDSVVAWLKERGYTVEKNVEKQLEEAEPYDRETWPVMEDPEGDLDDPYEGDDYDDYQVAPPSERPAPRLVEDIHLPEDAVEATKVDEGLDAALAKVREARAIDPGF